MRIIAGSAKGKNLISPPDLRTRPTSDRAREGLFSSLVSEFDSLVGLNFLDLFAGSAAVGVEALSRGAAIVHAVESDGDMGNVAISNFQLVKPSSGSYRVFHTKVDRFLESDHAAEKGLYDIIFMDPPYELSNGVIEELLTAIVTKNLLQPRGIIAIERESKSKPFTWPAELEEIKVRSYGQGSIYYGGYSASVLP
jgi:16S rRNA (guanine966-N2)-methyltransferase